MNEEAISYIMQKMSNCLDNSQMVRLEKTLFLYKFNIGKILEKSDKNVCDSSTKKEIVPFEYFFLKISVIYLQWTKRTGKQKPELPSPFSFAKE